MSMLAKFSPRRFDWVLFFSTFLLLALGLAAIYSVDLSRGSELIFFKKQLIASGIGLALLLGASLTRYTFFRYYAKFFYFGSLVLLTLVLFFGVTIRGTRGWFAVYGFSLQPVEIAKAGLIFMLAYVVYHFGRRFERPLFFVGTLALAALIIFLVMLQPDAGSSLTILGVWFGLMLILKARKLHLGIFLTVLIASSALAWLFFLQPYQKDRIYTFLNPERDALGAGYNVTQAIIAVGSGQWFGRGLGFGSQSQLRFLPEAQTDFIFSVIAEELGFAGVSFLLILYAVLIWRLARLIKNSRDDFAATVLSGVALLIFIQFFMNVGGNLGLFPIAGVTLPFVSYGGSSLIVMLFLVGVCESMAGQEY